LKKESTSSDKAQGKIWKEKWGRKKNKKMHVENMDLFTSLPERIEQTKHEIDTLEFPHNQLGMPEYLQDIITPLQTLQKDISQQIDSSIQKYTTAKSGWDGYGENSQKGGGRVQKRKTRRASHRRNKK
jgi:hypothetical protein